MGLDPFAWKFLAVANFHQYDAYGLTIFCMKPGDIFAADILYHKNVLTNYVIKRQRGMEKINEYSHKAYETSGKQELLKVFENLFSQLDLNCRGYKLSEFRQNINASLNNPEANLKFSNRHVKRLLIDMFGEENSFTYPRKKADSWMLFSSRSSQRCSVRLQVY